jgi:7-cyano-7-deazaguanine synthase
MDNKLKKAIVLVSGGMDSLVAAAIAKVENDELFFLHIKYFQRTMKREETSFDLISEHYKPTKKQIITLDFFKNFKNNSLTDSSQDIPNYLIDAVTNEIPNTYVPFRNGIFISIAAGFAEEIGATKIYTGAVEKDSSGYPDCSQKFFNNIEKAINEGTKSETFIEIISPLISMSKKEIVKLGNSLNVPFEHSWSCYQNEKTPCGVCDSCFLRNKAFTEAGVQDPILIK